MSGTLIVDVNKIMRNINSIKEQTGAKFCAVVKANAYGVGIELARYISDCVDYFAVSCVDEANKLATLTTKPILILSPPDICEIKNIKFDSIEFAVDNVEIINWLSTQNINFKIHVAVNTGMNRFGANFNDFLTIIENVAKSDNIDMRGVFSHFFDCSKKHMKKQYELATKFFTVARKNFTNILCHISNSAGIFYHEDMVRIGIGLYSANNFDSLSLVSRIKEIRTINLGDSVSYNANYVASDKRQIAVIPLGYADGIDRRLSGYEVYIKNRFCKIVGDVCMDCFMVDITEVDASVSEQVTIFGKCQNSVCNLAKHCDTICYEILTRMSDRIERKYQCKLSLENSEGES